MVYRVGMVRIVEDIPPTMQQFSKSSVTSPWKKPLPKKNGSFLIEVPQQWAAFLFALLQSPSHFVWAKEFIQSNSASALSPGGPTAFIEISKKLPDNDQLACCKLCVWSPISNEEEDYLVDDSLGQTEQHHSDCSTPNKSQGKLHLVDSKLRRSNRLKVRNKGFKQSSCGKSNRLGCSSKPPTLSNSIIRNLGKELC